MKTERKAPPLKWREQTRRQHKLALFNAAAQIYAVKCAQMNIRTPDLMVDQIMDESIKEALVLYGKIESKKIFLMEFYKDKLYMV